MKKQYGWIYITTIGIPKGFLIIEMGEKNHYFSGGSPGFILTYKSIYNWGDIYPLQYHGNPRFHHFKVLFHPYFEGLKPSFFHGLLGSKGIG